MASTGICVVPLSSFCTEHRGFLITLLEPDRNRFEETFRTAAAAITDSLESVETPAKSVAGGR